MADLLNDQSNLLEVASILGLTNWQLNEGMYNGCSFHTLQPLSAAISQSAIVNGAATGIYAFNKLLGTNLLGDNPNSRTNLFLTTLALMNVNDELTRKFVRKRLPYANQDNIEDMGLSGESYTINALFFGMDYLTALDNFLNAVLNPPPKDENVLIHPVLGEISGDTYLVRMKRRYSSDAYQAVMLELQFEAEQAIGWSKNTLSPTELTSQVLLGSIAALNAVGSAISLSTFLAK